MVSIGSNVIEFRWAVKKLADGTVIDSRLQVRTKDVVIAVLGVSLGVWSEWEDIETAVVEVPA